MADVGLLSALADVLAPGAILLSPEDQEPYPQGGNTSVCAGSIPSADRRGIVLSLGRMNRVLRLDRPGKAMIVQAGCILWAIHDAAAEIGRVFPLTLGAQGSCHTGGNISTDADGNARAPVLGPEVVLADGRIWGGLKTLRRYKSDVSLALMRSLKGALDPTDLMNPGKLVPDPP